MPQGAYHRLLVAARRHTRRADEAEDLVQEALLAAVAAGRADLADAQNLRWIKGVIRNQATLSARAAARRIRREALWLAERPLAEPAAETLAVPDILAGLPRGLKSLAALALTGHSRREIAFLLGISDPALRQRVAALRKTLAARGIAMPAGTPGLSLNLQYGRIRDALLPLLLAQRGALASHDPDGHLFIVRRS